ncbi:hypothetical protein KXD40_002672 [Peronospora effusa]|uniref:Uncharacterized protein n=1 Tax=Peronospora effusa TaxID=542832 RepID=A0A3M6V8J5_9STRA|nr:hypothetical protein DD238_007678 [Peronospora effusa]RQM11453.1 hypothetical protein DD237_007914 [Peronospora effusa]UIZ29315.1 hypothetical protein KXD40_002672 [Peronospora effusa]
MPNKRCLTCKTGDDTHHQSAVENTGCEETYLRVDKLRMFFLASVSAKLSADACRGVLLLACMKLNNGRVSACIEEWKKFRQCHEQGKAAHKSPSKKQLAVTER